MDKEFQEIKAAQEVLNTKLKEIRADMPDDPKIKQIWDSMYSMVNNIYSYVDYIAEKIYKQQEIHAEHVNNGHFPKIKTATQMQKCLEMMNAEDDFEIKKPVISMAKINKNLIIEATFNK